MLKTLINFFKSKKKVKEQVVSAVKVPATLYIWDGSKESEAIFREFVKVVNIGAGTKDLMVEDDDNEILLWPIGTGVLQFSFSDQLFIIEKDSRDRIFLEPSFVIHYLK